MIISSQKVYFKHPPTNNHIYYNYLVHGINRYSTTPISDNGIPVRVAEEEMSWSQQNIQAIVKRSTSTEVKDDSRPVEALSASRERTSDSANPASAIPRRRAARLRVRNVVQPPAPRPLSPRTVALPLALPLAPRPVSASTAAPRPVSASTAAPRPPVKISLAPASTAEVPDERVWSLVETLGWVDSDEIKRTSSYIKNRIPEESRSDLLRGMMRFKQTLEESFTTIPLYEALGEEEKNNVLFHIIGKGREFYNYAKQYPTITLYLFEGKYQNLYTMLRSL